MSKYRVVVETEMDRYGVITCSAKTLKSAKAKITAFENKNRYSFIGGKIYEGEKLVWVH